MPSLRTVVFDLDDTLYAEEDYVHSGFRAVADWAAEHLDVPERIRTRKPTTDTYSLPQTQEEFYFSLPFEQMDLCLYGHNNGLAPADLAEAIGISAEDVQRVYDDIDQKRRTTRYLHLSPQLVAPVSEVVLDS